MEKECIDILQAGIKSSGCTQKVLAKKAGVSEATISRWVNGHHKKQDVEKLKKFVQVLQRECQTIPFDAGAFWALYNESLPNSPADGDAPRKVERAPPDLLKVPDGDDLDYVAALGEILKCKADTEARDFILAIKSNLVAFTRSINLLRRVENLERRLEALEKQHKGESPGGDPGERSA